MNLFGLEGVGFIISLAMTLLVSGAIMFYCLRRFKILENSILEQGKVLQTFIIKQQNDSNSSLASTIALESARQQQQQQQSNTEAVVNSKIDVSDDSDEDGEVSEYSDDSSEEELFLENKDDNKEITLTTEEINVESILDNSKEELVSEGVKMINVENMTAFITEDLDYKSNQSDSESDDLELDDNASQSTELTDVKEVTELLSEKEKVVEEEPKRSKNLKKMKVDDLRDLVVKDSIVPENEAKNMKKDDLIKLLNEK
jgi:hypothetical protein